MSANKAAVECTAAEAPKDSTAGEASSKSAAEAAEANVAEAEVQVDMRNLYVVVYPGKYLTAAIVEMSTDQDSGDALANVFWVSHEASTYTVRGIPDMSRIKRFCGSMCSALVNICSTMMRMPVAVLVRTPAPAAAFASPATVGFLQCNTFFEAFMIGAVFSQFPHTPVWYCHPNAIKEVCLGDHKQWASREEEAAEMLSVGSTIAGAQLNHEREASCVLAAAYHYKKYGSAMSWIGTMHPEPEFETVAEVAKVAEAAEAATAKPAALPPTPIPHAVPADTSSTVWSNMPQSVKSPSQVPPQAHADPANAAPQAAAEGPKGARKPKKKVPNGNFKVSEPKF